jgi:hypothetical protein
MAMRLIFTTSRATSVYDYQKWALALVAKAVASCTVLLVGGALCDCALFYSWHGYGPVTSHGTQLSNSSCPL